MDHLIVTSFIISFLAGAIRLSVPIMLPAIGNIFAQSCGILNVGEEGTMIMGAIGGFLAAYFTGQVWFGFVMGILTGLLMGLLMAFMSVTVRANQVITGFALNILGGGLSLFLYRLAFGIRATAPSIVPPAEIQLPLLSDLPIIGPILFRQSPVVYVAFLVVPPAAFLLYKSKFGLAVRAVGENPAAADTRGIDVFMVRYICMMIDGGFAGFGGAFLSLAFNGVFAPGITGGQGFIALAVVILARWNPIGALWGALLFGGAISLQLRLQAAGAEVPYQFLLALPYVLTLMILVTVSKQALSPAALTKPYTRDEDG